MKPARGVLWCNVPMGNTLVIQSYRTDFVPGWVALCLDSVRDWARESRYDYRFVGDEIFSLVPDWYREKVAHRLPVATDYARLLLLQAALSGNDYDTAIWLDADLLVFDAGLSLDFEGTCAFGRERWVQTGSHGRPILRRNVHNAVCVFRRGCPVLPFLIQTVESIIRRVDPQHIAPQMVGPKLLTALHNICGFTLLDNIGALSPAVLDDLVDGGGDALALLRAEQPVPLQAANLCASLARADQAETACSRLLAAAAL